ncbi:hypothetical protein GCM10023237_58570 [Streptomyces coeruleoprunus]
MATSGAVMAADTGISPEKRVARSAPIRCMPMYQHTKPTTVAMAACHRRAPASRAFGVRRTPAPSSRRPTAAASRAATPQTVADRSLGPRDLRTGTASTAKPTSPTKAQADQAIPAASVRPHPWTAKAPAATSSAPYSTGRAGRRPSMSGTTTATTTGAQPTRTPGTAGSAVRSAASTARLKPTMPMAARAATRIQARRVRVRSGAVPPRPSRGRRSRQARP